MARPKKEVTKSVKVTVHLTQKEYKDLKEKSIRVNKSMSEFLCLSAYKLKINVPDPGKFKHRAIIRGLSNNVNQIARKVNANQNMSSEDMKLLQELKDMLEQQ